MNVYGQLFRAQLETLAADPSSAAVGRVLWNTTDGRPKFDDGTAIRAFLTSDQKCIFGTDLTPSNNVRFNRSGAATLEFLTGNDTTAEGDSNPSSWANVKAKIGGSNVDTFLTYQEQSSVATSPDAGSRYMYFKTDGKLYSKNSGGTETVVGGSSSGGINYILNPDAEVGTTGWSTYANAAASVPSDGTGGIPIIILGRTTTSPLRGTGSFEITYPGNAQGNGVSYNFSIDLADRAKVIDISFDYRVTSNYNPGTSTTNSDLVVYIYDVTNTLIIQAAPYKLVGGSTGSHKFRANFQASSNSSSYRLILHVANNNVTAWTAVFDNVVVGPQQKLLGSPITDYQSYTPVIAGLGTGSSTPTARWRRVGDSMQIIVRVLKDGSSGSGGSNISFSLPAGYSIDTTKLASANVHIGSADNNSTSTYITALTGSSLTSLFFAVPGSSFTSATVLEGTCTVPIAGWGSSVVMSSDTDTRVVAMQATGNPASASSGNPIIFPTANWDTHACYNSTTGLYTAPVSGFYRVHGFVSSATGAINLSAYVDSSTQGVICVTDVNGEASFTSTVKLNAGQTISLRPDNTFDAAGGLFNIERISGPATIAASEVVAARYATGTAGSYSTGNTHIVDYATKVFDTHGAVTTGTGWKFTAPVAGFYDVSAAIMTDATTDTAVCDIEIYKNGSQDHVIARAQKAGTTSCPYQLFGSGGLYLNAGDYIDIRFVNSSGNTRTLATNVVVNWVYIRKV